MCKFRDKEGGRKPTLARPTEECRHSQVGCRWWENNEAKNKRAKFKKEGVNVKVRRQEPPATDAVL